MTKLRYRTSLIAPPALLAVAVFWGAAFVVMKPAIEQQPFNDFLATRFLLAALVMIAAKPSVLTKLNWDQIKAGLPLGLILGAGYITQTIALEMTTAAITAFLTGLYVVLTPLLGWLILRRRASGRVFFGVILATVGLAFITISGASGQAGEITGYVWGLVCAVLYAAHIVGLSVWSRGRDIYALTVVQLLGVALLTGCFALSDGYQAPPNAEVWFAIIFCAVFATALAFFVQTWAQSRMDASRVAIILTTEIVFAALIAVLVGQEQLTLMTTLGGLLMLISMLIVEWPSRKDNTVEHLLATPRVE